MKIRILLSTMLVLLGFGPSFQMRGQESTTRVRTNAVLVDVTVRDRNGHPVPDLPQSAFRVFEDGVEQEIASFQPVTRLDGTESSGPASPSSSSSSPVEGTSRPSSEGIEGLFTAMVFDRLAPTSRTFARKAALTYVKEAPDDARIGIFFTDSSLRTLLFYTSDKDTLTRTISRALGGRNDGDDSGAAANISESAGGVSDPGALDSQNLASGTGASAAGLGAMSYRMSSMADSLSQSQQGYATTDSLHAIVSSLQPVTGRKAVLYFSEGIALPPGVEVRFRSLIHSANRAGVSFYPIDAAGLRIESTGATGDRGIRSAAGISELATSGTSSQVDELGPMSRLILEKNETMLRTDAHGTLNRLADETGGILIRETNDLDKGVREIHQDLYNYYLLTYMPQNAEFDGEFREIEVKVDHEDAKTVRHRKGYYAIDNSIDEPVSSFETPVLSLLSSNSVQNTIPLRSSVLNYPEPGDQGFVSLLAEVEAGTITYQSLEGQEVSDFAIVALIRDESGDVVRKLSQQYRLSRQETTDGQPADGILFYREVRLTPGTYSVEVAAYDAYRNEAGLSRSTLQIPARDPDLPSLSSIVLVRTADSLQGPAATADSPFRYENLLLYPNLGEPVSKAAYPEVTFYFTVFPVGGESPEHAFVDIIRGGQRLQTLRVPLPAPDQTGRIQMASGVSTADLQPGVYTLKVLILAGDKLVGRTCRFQLTP